jgi:hypothetical protein
LGITLATLVLVVENVSAQRRKRREQKIGQQTGWMHKSNSTKIEKRPQTLWLKKIEPSFPFVTPNLA